ncbi:MAG: VCBS repeat-containing protein [Planctomycetota bacterium]
MRIHSIQPLLFFALIGTAPAQTVCPSWESVGNTSTALMSVRRLAAADVNQDGLTDIVPIDLFGGPSPVLLNNGTGTFSQGFTFNPGHENFDAAFADFDGDGDPDCIMPMRGVVGGTGFPQGYGFALMSNLGGGSFGPPQYLFLDSIGMAPLGIAVGDMDGDGDPDVAFTAENAPTADYRLGVCLNTGGTLGMPSLVPMTPGIGELCLGDLDGDGDLDALLQTQNGCRVVFGSGQGTFLSGAGSSVYLNNPGSTVTSGVAIGDLNGDGSSDLVVSRRSGLTVWINNGSGAFPTLNRQLRELQLLSARRGPAGL